MPITHTVVKVPGQKVHAVADWNANHTITSPIVVGTLTLGSGSITDSSGAISFGNENLSTTGNITTTLGQFETRGLVIEGVIANEADIRVNVAADVTLKLYNENVPFAMNLEVEQHILAPQGKLQTADMTMTGTVFTSAIGNHYTFTDGGLLPAVTNNQDVGIWIDGIIDLRWKGGYFSDVIFANTAHLGATTVNYVEVSNTGDQIFHGSAGLVFGSFSGYHVNWLQVAAQNVWYNVVDADFINGLLNNVTHDGNGKLTVLKAGIYKVDVSSDWECSVVNKHIEIGFEVSGSGAAQTEGIVCNETKFADEEHTTGTTALLDLTANATIELCVRTTDVGNPTIKVDCVSLNCVQIGGT